MVDKESPRIVIKSSEQLEEKIEILTKLTGLKRNAAIVLAITETATRKQKEADKID